MVMKGMNEWLCRTLKARLRGNTLRGFPALLWYCGRRCREGKVVHLYAVPGVVL